MNPKDEKRTVILSRTRWALLVAVLLVGVSLGLVLAPARATHKPGHVPLTFEERVELGDPGKYGAVFVYCDGGYRLWVATTPNGSPSIYAVPAGGFLACIAPPFIQKP